MSIPVASPTELISFAISRGICVLAAYNRSETVLAPHSIFERNGEPYLRAVTLETDDRVPKVLKLGTFKLAGLTQIRLASRTFPGTELFKEVDEVRQRIARAAAPRRSQRDRSFSRQA
jgi:hypothetical protein